MNHPDLDRLTAWVHGLLGSADAREAEGHAAECAACREAVEHLREEGRVLSRELAADERLDALKGRLLRAAEGSALPAGRRPGRGLLWQIPVAAAVLLGLIATLLSPGPRHSLVSGRVALEDGREVAAPVDFAASRSWRFQALEASSLRLSDRSDVQLAPGTQFGVATGSSRGVQPQILSGEAAFLVAADSNPLTLDSPGGRVETAEGRFTVKIVFEHEGGTPMKGLMAGALVTVLAGSVSLTNAQGSIQASTGQAAVLARSEAPLFLASPQDKQEDLLRRLEEFAARVARLEAEVAQLEARNKQLKAQLSSNAAGGAWFGNPGQGVRMIQPQSGLAPGSSVIIELDANGEKKPEKKNEPKDR